MKKVKILQFGMSYRPGGIESFLLSYNEYINKDDIQMDFANVFKETEEQDFIKELRQNNNVKVLPNYRNHPIKFFKEFINLNKVENYDIFHYNMNSACYLLPLIVAKIAGIKIIISHSHNSSSDKGKIKAILHNINRNFIPLFANRFYACSVDAGKWFFSKKILEGKHFSVIKNAIDIDKFKYNEEIREKYRKDLKISKKTVVIGHVGRFKPQKNHDKLIDIFYEYQKVNNDSKLLLVGFGPLEDIIKDKVKKMNLEDKVIFLGERHDVENIMQAMDIFVLPSLYEGLGIVLIEAQASGLPILTTTKIPSEAHLNDNYFTLELSDSSKKWADTIINNIKIFNNRYKTNVQSYDIKVCAKDLENKYIKSSKIRIGHFVNGLVNGGVEKFLINYFSNMQNLNDYDLHIITQGESDNLCYKEFERLGFKIHTVTRKKDSIIKNYKEIKEILKENQFDIVHCHMTTTNFFPLLYSKLAGVKIRISHSHLDNTYIPLKEKIYIFLTRIISKNKFACSIPAAKYLFGSSSQVKIINNAINTSKFNYDEKIRVAKRKELNLSDDMLVIGHIGRFVPQKNHEFILEIIEKLDKCELNYKMVFIGIGELENKIKKRVKDLNLENKVLFLETRNDVNQLMQAFDLFILPSLFEGLGIVLIEAQASGLQSIISPFIPDEVMITNNICKVKLDSDKWVAQIIKFRKNNRKDYTQILIDNGYEISVEANKLDNLYKKMLNRR